MSDAPRSPELKEIIELHGSWLAEEVCLTFSDAHPDIKMSFGQWRSLSSIIQQINDEHFPGELVVRVPSAKKGRKRND